MSDDAFEIRIRGIAEIQRALFQFNARLGERINRLAIRKGANYMLKEIRNAAPVSARGSQEKDNTGRGMYTHFPPGRLKRAIKVKNSKINQIRKNGSVGVFITVSPGKKRNDPKGAWYGKYVEVGYNTGSANVTGREALTSRFTRVNRQGTTINYSRTARNSRAGQRLFRRDYRFKTATYRRVGAGRQVEGKHFVLNTFNNTAPTALAIMVEASEVATAQLARQLNLNVTGA
jgi:hypothetical protein